MSPRTQEQFASMRSQRKEQILHAALHVFAKNSYHGASMADVAKMAGISKGLIYNYFESKEELLKAVIEQVFTLMMDSYDLTTVSQLTREDLINVIDKTLEEVLENPERWRLYMSLSFQPDVTPLILEQLMPRMEPFMQALTDYFVENGHQDPIATMRYYLAVLDGVCMHILFDPEHFPTRKVKQMLIRQFT